MSDVEVLQGLGFVNSAEKQNTLMGEVKSWSGDRTAAAMAKIVNGSFGSTSKSLRDLVIERLSSLPAEIIKGLADKRLQIVENTLYSVKPITGKSQVIFFEDADTIKEGFTNVNNAKNKKDEFFLLVATQYQEGIGASATDPTTCVFGTASATSVNGDFDLVANGSKNLVNERSPLSQYADVSGFGSYKNFVNAIQLDNPKWIEPQVNFKATMRFAAANATANLFGRLKLIGASIVPY